MTTTTILGVQFLRGTPAEIVEAGARGGLVVVPSAPVLVGIERDPALRTAVQGADLAITDSGLMVLVWRLLTGEKIERVSGLEYLKLLLQELKPETVPLLVAANPVSVPAVAGQRKLKPEFFQPPQVSRAATGGVFWVMPTAAARDQNLAWLRSQGHPTTREDCYLAPKYADDGPLDDGQLLEMVKERRPAHVIICLGGGTQERLGWFLKQELEKAKSPATPLFSAENPGYVLKPASTGAVPGIHCIGAAIGFLSGEQVRIPMWVDYLYLGWLWRSVSAPGKFLPRYWRARKLVGLMWRYREKSPIGERPET